MSSVIHTEVVNIQKPRATICAKFNNTLEGLILICHVIDGDRQEHFAFELSGMRLYSVVNVKNDDRRLRGHPEEILHTAEALLSCNFPVLTTATKVIHKAYAQLVNVGRDQH